MIFPKKGDLALSTNAIVVLIIAVIMLGLIIGFVTNGFRVVSNQFLQKVDQLPEPPTASDANPITTSELTIAKAGDQFGTKIAVFNNGVNPTAGATTNNGLVRPTIYCGQADVNEWMSDASQWSVDLGKDPVVDHGAEQENGKAIDSKSENTFIYIAKIKSGAVPGKQLCQVVALLPGAGKDASGNPMDTMVSSDIVVEVQ